MLNFIPLPALKDNYIWILHDSLHAVVVDPGDAVPVLAYLEACRLKLAAILCTHHHNDHTGGVCQLVQVYNVPVYGPQHEIIPCISRQLAEGDTIEIAELALKLEVIDIPGHTRGHIAFIGAGGVFCGDTLFGCGCGKLLGGTATQLFQALQRLANMPDTTRIYCGHEYTEANILFALACEPDNAQLKQRQREVHALRAAGQPTLPSTIALEKATNPFLRYAEPAVMAAVQRESHTELTNETSVFTALRSWKDRF